MGLVSGFNRNFNQFFKRRIVGHHRMQLTTGNFGGIGASIIVALRNPTASGVRMHFVRLKQHVDLLVPFTAAAAVTCGWRKATSTATSTAGTLITTEAQTLSGAASVITGRYGAALSGGNFVAATFSFDKAGFVQPAATGSTTTKFQSVSDYQPDEPIPVDADNGIGWGNLATLGAGGQIIGELGLEWYESIAD